MNHAYSTKLACALTVAAFGCSALKAGDVLPPAADSSAPDRFPVDAAGEASPMTVGDASADEGAHAGPEQQEEAGTTDATVAASDGPAGADAPTESGPTPDASAPLGVAPGHLRLWLAADHGVTCSAGRVTRWADQSGHSDDATLLLGELGPQCMIPQRPHTIAGVDVPYFSAPANGNVVDETLDVDLSFLVNANYTLFAIERRWADGAYNGFHAAAYFLGTTLPPGAETLGCAAATHQDLCFGYEYRGDSPGPSLAIDNGCDGFYVAMVGSVPSPPPTPTTEDTAMFDVNLGYFLWIDGTLRGSSAKTTPVLTYTAGSIGRAVFRTDASPNDQRFDGDLAEILAYDTALDDAERMAVEAYLKGKWGY